MEVSGIDPEIVGGTQAVGQSATPQSTQVPKSELDPASGGVAADSSAVAAHNASLVANQYAQAATYGPPVTVQSVQPNHASVESHGRVGKRRVRLGWTEDETRNLMEGCKRHGVGNWKKILTDPSFQFNCRTAVDLKDRFRTSFPEEYSRLYPNARTHKVKGKASNSAGGPPLIKVSRKERRAFTADEDERLLQGFLKHGPAWSKIQRDQMLVLGDRRSTDLRDRFRNAYPERYTAAGYKGRTSGSKSSANTSNSDLPIGGGIDDDLAQQQAMGRYMPNAQMMQQMQYPQYAQSQQYGAQARSAQQYNPQAQQQYQQYSQPMYYGMGMNQMPMQMANMNKMSQINPQMSAQMRQVPQMNMGQMGVWQNQQQ